MSEKPRQIRINFVNTQPWYRLIAPSKVCPSIGKWCYVSKPMTYSILVDYFNFNLKQCKRKYSYQRTRPTPTWPVRKYKSGSEFVTWINMFVRVRFGVKNEVRTSPSPKKGRMNSNELERPGFIDNSREKMARRMFEKTCMKILSICMYRYF